MARIRDYVKEMVDFFKRSSFFLNVATNMQYDEDTIFNENNVTMYLAELEEYISLLITYLAYKQENPDAAISSLSLERMIHKEFDKGPTNVSLIPIYLTRLFRLMLPAAMMLTLLMMPRQRKMLLLTVKICTRNSRT